MTKLFAAATGALAALAAAAPAAAADGNPRFWAADDRAGLASGTYEYGASIGTSPTFPVFLTGRLTADFGRACHAAYATPRLADAKPTWVRLAAGCGLASVDFRATLAVPKRAGSVPGVRVCWANDDPAAVLPTRNCGPTDPLTAA
ncbi:hypothetical protein GCM10010123_18650 [Pilimelia anulata]|uniref:Uncharacterized protein n=1 Tax=Pilimelia anulata TaxID=53371 RepID=A0A8J3F9T5_9ACTN|nr:hypothetical protein [Pilimelia anulata]GGJ89299.1 hypothetical protein GCM10010123_18650 [Pilimelia anulata]